MKTLLQCPTWHGCSCFEANYFLEAIYNYNYDSLTAKGNVILYNEFELQGERQCDQHLLE